MRNLLATTALAGTALAAIPAPASAETISTDLTAPVRTSTIKDGAPDTITIAEEGSVTVTSGTAVTMDSNHAVTNQGEIKVDNANGGIGIVALEGTSGDIVNAGTITVDEPYTPTDGDKDGDLDGPFALGSNRFGIRTMGAHSGNISNSGTITVEGNDSAGIQLGGPLTGDFTHEGTTSVLGDRSTGIDAGAIDGDVRLAGTVAVTGEDSVGARFSGDVSGAMVVQGTIASTGYRHTNAPTDPSKLDDDDLLQGGSALVIEGDVAGGILLAGTPQDNDDSDEDEDGNEDETGGENGAGDENGDGGEGDDDSGNDDPERRNAVVASYGEAPAMVVGAADRDIAIGPVAETADKFGLQIDGAVAGSGVYSGIEGNGLVIGGQGGAVTIAKGIGIAGSVSASAKDASATALRIGAGASVPQIQVSGTVNAAGGGTEDSQAVAILVDDGASVEAIRNSGTIKAAASGEDGSATAILDRSGGVELVENSGRITASGAEEDSGRNIAIDLSANAEGATIRQTQVASNFTAPSIEGDVRFGGGDDVFEIADGSVEGDAFFGAGDNELTLSGDAEQTGNAMFGAGNDTMSLAGTSSFNGLADFGGGADTLTLNGKALFSGTLANAGNLAVDVSGGTLNIAKPATIGSLDVGADGVLAVTLDSAEGSGTAYTVNGEATFAEGATMSLRLADVSSAEGRYVVLEAESVSGLSGVVTKTDLIPFMFKASLAEDAGANRIAVDIAKRNATELGLNRSQATAYDAVFAALASDEEIESVFLGITNGDLFRHSVNQMLPDHAGAAFEGVSLGSRTMARQIADPQTPLLVANGLNIYLGAAGWGADKDQGESAAFNLSGLGFSAAGEVDIGLGNVGVAATWLWNEWENGGDNNRVISNTYELSAYWRGEWGGFSAFTRGAIGTVGFDGRRTFTGRSGEDVITRESHRDWDGVLTSFTAGAAFEGGGRHFFYRPTVSFDYLRLKEDGYSETGGEGLNLIVEDRTSDEAAVNGGLVLGVDFVGRGQRDTRWFRIETEGGWREILSGSLGATTARFEDGESFTLEPEQIDSGWYARLRAMGGAGDFNLGGEIGAEDRLDRTAITVRGTMRLGF